MPEEEGEVTLDELQKLCDEAMPGPWEARRTPDGVDYIHIPAAVSASMNVLERLVRDQGACNMRFACVARTYMPKLIAVARAAQVTINEISAYFGTDESGHFSVDNLRAALKALVE